MNWNTILETFIALLLLAIVTFLGNILYKNRNKILNFIKRLHLLIFPVNFNIALSLDFNEGLNSGNYFNQIKKNLQDLIKNSNLEKEIVVKDFSDIQKFKNIAQVEKFRGDKKIDLIIWGGFTNDNLKTDGNIINKIDLKFTFGHPRDEKNLIGKMIKLDMSSKFARKNYWQIVESNSLNDVEIISNNLFHLSTYILALSLKLFGKLEKSLLLFESLYTELVRLKDDFNKFIVPHLINCYEVLSLEYGIGKNDYPTAIKYARKIYDFNNKDFNAIANLAVFYYKNDNKSEANKFIQLLIRYYSGNPITLVDLAFIRILENDYTNAYKQYDKLIKCKRINFNSQEVIDFLNDEYNKSKEPGLLYGSGIISYYYGDREIGKQDLKSFLRKAKKQEYKSMISKTKKLI